MARIILMAIVAIATASLPARAYPNEAVKEPADAGAEAERIASSAALLLNPLVEDDLISGSVLVHVDGRLILGRSFGLANRKSGQKNSPSTRFRIASVSKSLTAVAVLQLVERGVLRLDDTLDEWFPGFAQAGEITIEELLAHRSGIPSDVYLPEFREMSVSGVTLAEAIDWIRQAAPRFEPGERFEYSNSGYLVLSAIIEQATGEPFDSILARNIFQPAGMADTGLDKHYAGRTRHARGYSQTDAGQTVETPYRHPSYGWGYGALYSTPEDLSRFARALFDGDLLSEDLLGRMMTGTATTPWNNKYGLGWFVDSVGDVPMVEAIGSTGGFVATIRYFPGSGTTIVVTLNRDFLLYDRLFDQLSAIALGKEWSTLFAGKADRDALSAFAGNYTMDDGVVLQLDVADGGATFGDAAGSYEFPVYVLSETEGYVPAQNALLRFKKAADGPVELFALFGNYAWAGRREE